MADQGVNSSLNYTMDSLGRLIGHNLTLNEETIHTESISYDEADRINLFMPDNQTHYIYDYREDNGWLDTLTYPNGMQKKIVYEANRDYISNVSYFRSQGTLLSSQSVTRDNMGRIGSLAESRLGQANRSRL